MTKSELATRLSNKNSNISLKDINLVVDVVLNSISSSLIGGDRVELRGFGSFSTRERAPRKARNPKTGANVELGVRQAVYFRASKNIRDKLNA